MKKLLQFLLCNTPLQYWPVRVRSGLAKGARWTLYPHSCYWRGNTEPETESAILNYVRGGDCCWDLGTHFGIYTVGMGMRVGPNGSVYGFEPDPVSFARCQLHIRHNNLSWVKVFNYAVSADNRESQLILQERPGTPFSRIATEDEDEVRPCPQGRKHVSIKTCKLDDLVTSGEILPPQFIKMDVEGHGAKALQGARETIQKHRPVILVAFHSKWEQSDTRNLLKPMGYAPFDTSGKQSSWSSEYALLLYHQR
jgi:FkbM family methyltransferase